MFVPVQYTKKIGFIKTRDGRFYDPSRWL